VPTLTAVNVPFGGGCCGWPEQASVASVRMTHVRSALLIALTGWGVTFAGPISAIRIGDGAGEGMLVGDGKAVALGDGTVEGLGERVTTATGEGDAPGDSAGRELGGVAPQPSREAARTQLMTTRRTVPPPGTCDHHTRRSGRGRGRP
jgi:hypothetical protein